MISGETKIIAFLATTNASLSRSFYEKKIGLKCISSDEFATAYNCNGTMLRVQNVDNLAIQLHTQLGWQVKDLSREVRNMQAKGIVF